jgi:hypothetical protein
MSYETKRGGTHLHKQTGTTAQTDHGAALDQLHRSDSSRHLVGLVPDQSFMTHPFPVEPASEVVARPPRETLYAAKRALFERNNSVLLFALCVVCLALGAVLFWTHGVYVASLERQPI